MATSIPRFSPTICARQFLPWYRNHGNRDRAILAAERLFVEAFHRRRHPGHDDHLVRSCLALCHERSLSPAFPRYSGKWASAIPYSGNVFAKQPPITGQIITANPPSCTGTPAGSDTAETKNRHRMRLYDPYTFSRSFKRSVGVVPSFGASACSLAGGLDC